MSKAPWTEREVENLNDYQRAGMFHPFTCGTHRCREDLTATTVGWVCKKCGYAQDWAHEFMVNGEWRQAMSEMHRLFFDQKR